MSKKARKLKVIPSTKISASGVSKTTTTCYQPSTHKSAVLNESKDTEKSDSEPNISKSASGELQSSAYVPMYSDPFINALILLSPNLPPDVRRTVPGILQWISRVMKIRNSADNKDQLSPKCGPKLISSEPSLPTQTSTQSSKPQQAALSDIETMLCSDLMKSRIQGNYISRLKNRRGLYHVAMQDFSGERLFKKICGSEIYRLFRPKYRIDCRKELKRTVIVDMLCRKSREVPKSRRECSLMLGIVFEHLFHPRSLFCSLFKDSGEQLKNFLTLDKNLYMVDICCLPAVSVPDAMSGHFIPGTFNLFDENKLLKTLQANVIHFLYNFVLDFLEIFGFMSTPARDHFNMKEQTYLKALVPLITPHLVPKLINVESVALKPVAGVPTLVPSVPTSNVLVPFKVPAANVLASKSLGHIPNPDTVTVPNPALKSADVSNSVSFSSVQKSSIAASKQVPAVTFPYNEESVANAPISTSTVAEMPQAYLSKDLWSNIPFFISPALPSSLSDSACPMFISESRNSRMPKVLKVWRKKGSSREDALHRMHFMPKLLSDTMSIYEISAEILGYECYRVLEEKNMLIDVISLISSIIVATKKLIPMLIEEIRRKKRPNERLSNDELKFYMNQALKLFNWSILTINSQKMIETIVESIEKWKKKSELFPEPAIFAYYCYTRVPFIEHVSSTLSDYPHLALIQRGLYENIMFFQLHFLIEWLMTFTRIVDDKPQSYLVMRKAEEESSTASSDLGHASPFSNKPTKSSSPKRPAVEFDNLEPTHKRKMKDSSIEKEDKSVPKTATPPVPAGIKRSIGKKSQDSPAVKHAVEDNDDDIIYV